MTPEEITGGREPRRWLRPVGVLVAVALVVGFVADRLVRDNERDALRRCVVEAEADFDDLAYRTAGLEIYIASAVDRPDVSPAVRASLRGIVQETVLRGLPPLYRDQVRCMSVRAWHPVMKAGRDAYLGYLEERLAQVRRAVEDIDALHVRLPEVTSARARARAALSHAGVPLAP